MTSKMVENALANIGFFLYQLDSDKMTRENTWTSSYEDFKKETIRSIQPNLIR